MKGFGDLEKSKDGKIIGFGNFWSHAKLIESDSRGVLEFPEDYDEIAKIKRIVIFLPNPPELPSGNDPELKKQRSLLSIKYKMACVSLYLPYLKPFFSEFTEEEANDLDWWKEKRNKVLALGGDVLLVDKAANERMNLEDTLGKKFSAFHLTPQQLLILENTRSQRTLVVSKQKSWMNSIEYTKLSDPERRLKIANFERELDMKTSNLWKILSLSSDYLSPFEKLSLNDIYEDQKAKEPDGIIKKKDVFEKRLLQFRLDEYKKYSDCKESEYKLPPKF